MEFIDYIDVWGNQVDGFDVNMVARRNVQGNVPDTPIDVLKLLVDNDLIFENVNFDHIVIEMDEYGAELTERKTGYPIGRLVWNE